MRTHYHINEWPPRYVFYNPYIDELFVVGVRAALACDRLGLVYIGEF